MCYPSLQSEPSLPGECPPRFRPSDLPTDRHSPPPSHPPVHVSPLQWLLTLQHRGFRDPLRPSPYLRSQFYPLPSPELRPRPSSPYPIPPEARCPCVYIHAVGMLFSLCGYLRPDTPSSSNFNAQLSFALSFLDSPS